MKTIAIKLVSYTSALGIMAACAAVAAKGMGY